MSFEIRSYEGLVGYPFGSAANVFTDSLGPPIFQRTNGDGEVEYHYDGFIIRFDAQTAGFRECTFARQLRIRLNDDDVEWSTEGLRRLCVEDGSPQQCHGTILLLRLGVSLTGVTDDEVSDRSLTAFRRGDWDDFKGELKPYNVG